MAADIRRARKQQASPRMTEADHVHNRVLVSNNHAKGRRVKVVDLSDVNCRQTQQVAT